MGWYIGEYEEDGSEIWLNERTAFSPDFSVYYDLIRGWCWTAFADNSDPIDGAGGFASADAAKKAAELWLSTKED